MLFGAAEIATGRHSLGQTLAGIGLGLVLHLYQTRSPGYVRYGEALLSLVAALTVAFVRKGRDDSMNMTPMAEYFASAVWQIAALLLPLLWFDSMLLRETLKKSVTAVHQVDFLFYVPLGDSINVRYDLTEPEPKNR